MSESLPALPLMVRARLLSTGLLFGLLLGGAGAGYVYFQMNAQRVVLLTVIDDAKEAITTAESSARTQLQAAEAQSALLAARLDLYQAADAVREQNYGTAREHIVSARARVETAAPPGTTVVADLASLTILPESPETALQQIAASLRALQTAGNLAGDPRSK